MLQTIKDKIDKALIIRFIKFGIVGTSGIAVNTGVLWLLKGLLGVPLAIAPIFAIGTAVFSNFLLNNFWTWNENKQIRKHSFLHRLWRYYLSASLGALINYTVLLSLTNFYTFMKDTEKLPAETTDSILDYLSKKDEVLSKLEN